MAGNPWAFNMGAGGGIPMGRFRMSPRKPSVRVNSTARKMAKKAVDKKAMREGERRSTKAVETFIKKEGRWPSMMEADRFSEMEYFKGVDSVKNFYKNMSPARRAVSIHGRYGNKLREQSRRNRWLKQFEGMRPSEDYFQ